MEDFNENGFRAFEMTPEKIQKEYLTVAETSEYCGISQRTLRNLLKDHLNPIPFYRVGPAGRIIRIKKSEFDEWMQSQKSNQGTEIDDLVAEILK